MALIGQVGAKRWRAKVALMTVYLVLCLAAITTLYPFAMMISTALRTQSDQNDNHLVPPYLGGVLAPRDKTSLLGKYLDDKYAADENWLKFVTAASPGSGDLSQLPLFAFHAGFRHAPGQVTSRLTQQYQAWVQARYDSIEALNRAYSEENSSWLTVLPPVEMYERKTWNPPKTTKFSEWNEFKSSLPVEFRIPLSRHYLWISYVRSTYENQIAKVPSAFVGSAKTFETLPVLPIEQLPKKFWDSLRPELASYNRDASTSQPSVNLQAETDFVKTHSSEIKKEFAGRNFRYVWSYLSSNGRAIRNTVILCFLTVVVHLFFNAAAAYALSRFPNRHTYKILLLLLATMAFPAEVAMIPSFLLLKSFGLLNTFAALVLPTAASGYMIFLLKGFFDSLPREVFESGELDGAPEITLFRKIALPMSRAVLGYVSLLSFMAAYGAFLFAFLVCQDKKMWTMMVAIYQLQLVAPKSVVMAALTLAAIPTLLVFLFSQKIILRGIVLPGEK